MAHAVLGGEDAAWLHMEEATNPMVVNGLLELEAPLGLERAYALFDRLGAIPRFRSHPVEPPLRLGLPRWKESATFDVTQHVEHVQLDSADADELAAFIGSAASSMLIERRAPWRAFVIDRPGKGTSVLFRVHHAVADGFALLGVLRSLCDDGGAWRGATLAPPQPPRSRKLLDAAMALARVVALPSDAPTLLKGSLGTTKRVAWSEPLALADVKAAARCASATVNDVLVATATGALGRYLARRGERTAELELHAMVPVNLRPGDAPTTLGNRFGLVVLGLPVGIADPFERVLAVRQRTKLLKATPEAVVTHGLLRALGHAPRPLEDLAVSFFGKKTSLVLTNVPGPRARLELAGVPVSRLMFWVPQSGRMGLGISILSYAGAVTVGIIADAARVPDPDALVADLHADYLDLQASVAARAARPA